MVATIGLSAPKIVKIGIHCDTGKIDRQLPAARRFADRISPVQLRFADEIRVPFSNHASVRTLEDRCSRAGPSPISARRFNSSFCRR